MERKPSYYELEDAPRQVRVSVSNTINEKFANRVCETRKKKNDSKSKTPTVIRPS